MNNKCAYRLVVKILTITVFYFVGLFQVLKVFDSFNIRNNIF